MEDNKKEQKPMEREKKPGLSRRSFLRLLGAAAIGAAASQAVPNFGVSAGETQGGRPAAVEQKEGLLHLDAIEVADLNPDGGRPLFVRVESKPGENLLDKPNFSKVSQSVSDALKIAGDIIQQKNIKVDGVTAVVQGKKIEVSGKEPTVTPTAPTKDQASVPILISARGFGILVDGANSWFYENIDFATVIGVTQTKDLPANLYVFPKGDNLFLADSKNGGIVYAQGATNTKNGVEWTKVTAPEKSEWDLGSDKAPILSAGIVEVIRDGKEKAVMIPGTAIAVSMEGVSEEYWNYIDSKLKGITNNQVSASKDLVLMPVNKTDKQIETVISNYTKTVRKNPSQTTFVDVEGNLTSDALAELNPQMAILFFDRKNMWNEISDFFANKLGATLTEKQIQSIMGSKAFTGNEFFNMIKVYNAKTNIQYVLVAMSENDFIMASSLTYRIFDAIKFAYSDSTSAYPTPDSLNLIKQFRIQCASVVGYGLVGPSSDMKAIKYLTNDCTKAP